MLFICIDCISLHINIIIIDKMIAILSRLYRKYWVLNSVSSLAYF